MLFILVHTIKTAWVGRIQRAEVDRVMINKEMLKTFLSRSRQFELTDNGAGDEFSIKVKTENLNSFLQSRQVSEGAQEDEELLGDENRKSVYENNFSRIT